MKLLLFFLLPLSLLLTSCSDQESGGSSGNTSCLDQVGSTNQKLQDKLSIPLIIDFGASAEENEFGSNWESPILDSHMSYTATGPGGLKMGREITLMHAGAMGNEYSFEPGDKIVVTFYNDHERSQIIMPHISFTKSGKFESESSDQWYGMTKTRIPAKGTATSVFEFDDGSKGAYSLVNIDIHAADSIFRADRYTKIICDKIELAGPETDFDSFDSFKRTTRTINAHVYTGQGTITPSEAYGQMVDVKKGDDITFTFEMMEGMDEYDVIVDGVNVNNQIHDNTYTFTNVNKDHTIAVGFFSSSVPDQVLNITHGINGTMSPTGKVRVDRGQEAKIKYIPKRWFTYSSTIYLDGAELEKDPFFWTYVARTYYWFTDIQKDHTLHVNFEYHPTQCYKTLEDLQIWDGSQTVPEGTISPEQITYKGAFRVPYLGNASDITKPYWGDSGNIAYYPDGDGGEGNSSDAFKGSLFFTGHEWWTTEMSIPQPVMSKNFYDLNIATELQPFRQVRLGEVGEEKTREIIYLPHLDKIFFGQGKFSYADRSRPYHGWYERDLSNPEIDGLWYLGGLDSDGSPLQQGLGVINDDGDEYSIGVGLSGWHSTLIPDDWAIKHLGGVKTLGVGKHQNGPSLFAVAPWDKASVVPGDWDSDRNILIDRGKMQYIPLLAYYRTQYQEELPTIENMGQGDAWLESSWLVSNDRQAFMVAGMVGYGNTFYNNGAAGINWNQNGRLVLKFYDTAELAAVAAGELMSYEPQPYATLDITSYMFWDYFGERRKPDRRTDNPVIGLAYDHIHNYLYIVEIGGHDELGSLKDYPVVHVFQVDALNLSKCK